MSERTVRLSGELAEQMSDESWSPPGVWRYLPDLEIMEGRTLSRSDVLEWLGWEKCEDCDGLNEVGTNGKKATARNPAHTPCPNCLDGLVPPASQVVASRDAIAPLLIAALDAGEPIESATLARAALIAAIREGVGE